MFVFLVKLKTKKFFLITSEKAESASPYGIRI